MPRFRPAITYRLPTLLLLGLLALLLWGQCALLFPEVYGPPVFNGWVISTDSLRTAPPATLYLTLGLRNNRHRSVTLHELDGTVRFEGQAFPFSATTQLHDTLLARGTQVRQAVAIPLRHLAPDSLNRLQAALAKGSQRGSGLSLNWQATVWVPPRQDGRHPEQYSFYVQVPALSQRR